MLFRSNPEFSNLPCIWAPKVSNFKRNQGITQNMSLKNRNNVLSHSASNCWAVPSQVLRAWMLFWSAAGKCWRVTCWNQKVQRQKWLCSKWKGDGEKHASMIVEYINASWNWLKGLGTALQLPTSKQKRNCQNNLTQRPHRICQSSAVSGVQLPMLSSLVHSPAHWVEASFSACTPWSCILATLSNNPESHWNFTFYTQLTEMKQFSNYCSKNETCLVAAWSNWIWHQHVLIWQDWKLSGEKQLQRSYGAPRFPHSFLEPLSWANNPELLDNHWSNPVPKHSVSAKECAGSLAGLFPCGNSWTDSISSPHWLKPLKVKNLCGGGPEIPWIIGFGGNLKRKTIIDFQVAKRIAKNASGWVSLKPAHAKRLTHVDIFGASSSKYLLGFSVQTPGDPIVAQQMEHNTFLGR